MEGTSSGPPATVSMAEFAAQITELVRVAHALEQLLLIRALEAAAADVPLPEDLRLRAGSANHSDCGCHGNVSAETSG